MNWLGSGGGFLSSAGSLGRAPACAVVATCLLLTACGRPATEGECREILRKAAELELKSRLDSDPSVIENEVRAIEQTLSSAVQTRCVGKRISDKAMDCVRKAKTADEVVSECLR